MYRYGRREKGVTLFLKLVHTLVMLLENVSSIHNISVCVYMIYSDFSTDVLKFYNSHSLLHPREVFYSFKIIPPEFEVLIDDTESTDPMANEGALETESTDPMANEGALKIESTDPMANEGALETESTDPMANEGALKIESTDPMANEGALETESTDPMANEGALIPPESKFSRAIIDETESAGSMASEGALTQKSTIKHTSSK